MMALSPLVMMLVAPMICIYNRSKKLSEIIAGAIILDSIGCHSNYKSCGRGFFSIIAK